MTGVSKYVVFIEKAAVKNFSDFFKLKLTFLKFESYYILIQ
jgi:hypothetical protein